LQREIEAVDRASDPVDYEISFGPFRLLPARRLLLEGDAPVSLGSRALDLLIALAARPGEVVGKSELIAKVWPDTFVVEGNLKLNGSIAEYCAVAARGPTNRVTGATKQ
jgi:DNA-binding response OmpR family regulator